MVYHFYISINPPATGNVLVTWFNVMPTEKSYRLKKIRSFGYNISATGFFKTISSVFTLFPQTAAPVYDPPTQAITSAQGPSVAAGGSGIVHQLFTPDLQVVRPGAVLPAMNSVGVGYNVTSTLFNSDGSVFALTDQVLIHLYLYLEE